MKKAKLGIFFAVVLIIVATFACGKKTPPVVDTQIAPVKIAVNNGFMPTAELLASDFTTNTGIAVEFTSGSDQELVDMVLQGGDYDVFMASDVEHPQALVEKGKAQSEGALVYAYGIAALYSKTWKLHWTAPEYLYSGQFSTLGIPSPEDNRYGKAAIAMLKNIDVYDNVENKIVYTNNEEETLAKVKAKELDAGFIAYSSLSDRSKRWAWIVPQKVYDPIGQGAVLITKENVNDSAKIWMGYLNSDGARSIIQQSGYGILNSETVSSSN
ncbi:MAG: molybdate ABC transporter substrate-binding protein [Thermodesulfobacteriota bacterium]|nr:MAG: molybdate ABC transporter substrate-binding protein [Thermodesulfobacteriota bacterium]